MPKIPNIWKGRVIGAVGSSVPVVGDLGVLTYIKKHSGTVRGLGARQGLKYLGGPIAAVSWGLGAYELGKKLDKDPLLNPRVRTVTVTRRISQSGGLGRRLTSRSVTPRAIPRRGKRCPPGYRYDAKRKMCIQTFKR